MAETAPGAGGLKRGPGGVAEDTSAATKAPRTGTWREFSSTDPLYALLGEVQEDKVVAEDGEVRTATMTRYLEILVVQQAAKKPKDWIAIWAAMGIPIESQGKVLTEIVRFGLQYSPLGGLGAVLAELLKGHRVKTKAIEEAVQGAMLGAIDQQGVLREMLFSTFPKGPHSEWGWSRVGWSWQEWWKLAAKTLSCLESTSAFDELGLLLDRIEAEGGKPLVQQSMQWSSARLTKVRELLCKFGDLQDEEDLTACLDAGLR
eukprot:TRINITY_DN25153_c0_g1_i1.p1 TRINITY_DN25153_c0_g1~~TRINITY_DN25153_c0_g1_i1.p1  ORF type:complete len:277 (+),score=49.26 TRINITY_DN25153_c0_g1_i1:54-833(+)